jgi:epoxyqueuosine reductase
MAYLARLDAVAKRGDPGKVLEGCLSILSLGVLYTSPLQLPSDQQATGGGRGRVAAYAWGEDYHTVLPPRLERLAQKISAMLEHPIRQRHYTDTGPILERDLAQAAGLGWIAKNTCLISPDAGSFFFLAELMLDVEIEPDPAFPYDRCGSCRRCIEACPTACILPDRTIDATRCISYLTIENKGPIPPELRPQVGNWIFGCDVCQEVCPWNLRFAPTAGDPAFAPRPGFPNPILRDELKLAPGEFNLKFKNSPILRARRRGYLRNVCVALGNQPDAGSVPDLVLILESELEPLVRSHAAWALGRIHNAATRVALEKSLKAEMDVHVLVEIREALAGQS